MRPPVQVSPLGSSSSMEGQWPELHFDFRRFWSPAARSLSILAAAAEVGNYDVPGFTGLRGLRNLSVTMDDWEYCYWLNSTVSGHGFRVVCLDFRYINFHVQASTRSPLASLATTQTC